MPSCLRYTDPNTEGKNYGIPKKLLSSFPVLTAWQEACLPIHQVDLRC